MSSILTHDSTAGSLSGPVRVAHDRDGRSASSAVVEAVAGLAGVDPDALADEAGIVLYDHVDPDALDSLVEHRSDGGFALSFSVAKYDVWVDGREAVARPAE